MLINLTEQKHTYFVRISANNNGILLHILNK